MLSKIPPSYIAYQLTNNIKEKLDFIRCFPTLKNSSHAEFEIGVRNKRHLDLLKDLTWYFNTQFPQITANILKFINDSTTYVYHRLSIFKARKCGEFGPPWRSITTENSTNEKNIVKIGWDKEVIAQCQFIAVENSGFFVNSQS